jgi:1,6-anhydro-N-acetylmuramate kinase
MNQSLIKLREISQKEKRIILGLMSGTSADGLDISICSVSGSGTETSFELMKFTTAAYSPIIIEKMKTFLFDENAGQADILRFQAAIEEEWVELIRQKMDEWEISPGEIDLISSHGQTFCISHQAKISGQLHGSLLTGITLPGDWESSPCPIFGKNISRQDLMALRWHRWENGS